MSTRSLEIKVGIFVSLGILVVVASVFMLGGDRMFLTNYYHLQAEFPQVQGLQQGSVVSLAGIPVGNVAQINMNTKKSISVVFRVDVRFQNRITKESIAQIKTQGALGDKYLYISPGNGIEPTLQDGEWIRTDIGGDFLSAIMDKSDGLDNVFELINQLKILVTNLNADGRSRQFMVNLTNSSEHLSHSLQKLDSMMQDLHGKNSDGNNVKNSIDRLASILAKIDDGRGTLGALINDPSIHNQLKQFLGGSKRNTYLKTMIRKTIERK